MRNSNTPKLARGHSFKQICSSMTEYNAYVSLDFNQVEQRAMLLADSIENKIEGLIDILLEYESYEVATDEIARTLDLLRNLKDNENYFKLRVGAITTFLPRNQPVYTFTCFVIIPSLMASEVHFRVPHIMQDFLPKVFEYLDIFKLFPNIIISTKERIEFLKNRSALIVDPKTNENRPVTDVVIFTGTSAHADQLRLVFDRRTLFISNGAGHNPIVISEGSNIRNATEAVLTLTLYNQGQDCAAPNTILVHQNIYQEFMKNFYREFAKIKIGPYRDHSCRVGPISNPDDLKHIEVIIVNNRKWLDRKTSGVIHTAEAIVEPTIICKPLREGGNYNESFAPILFIQKYSKDEELALYFESPYYAQNAMYITLYGESNYVKNLIGRPVGGRVLHYPDTFLHNTHLHAPGIERGTQPYGGYGPSASSVSIHGKITAMPTLPQRDIFEWVVKPLLKKKIDGVYKKALGKFTRIKNKNVEKILRLRPVRINKQNKVKIYDNTYFDLTSVKITGARFVKIERNNIYHLLNEPNTKYIDALSVGDLKLIRALRMLLKRKPKISYEEFNTSLLAIPKKFGSIKGEDSAHQLRFFQNIYQLLFKKDHGPRLGPFLWELKGDTINTLLDV